MIDRALDERLTCLMEECAEVIQVCSKVKRFGFDDIHPQKGGKANRQLLEEELGVLMFWIEYLSFVSKDVHPAGIEEAKLHKESRVKDYLFHN